MNLTDSPRVSQAQSARRLSADLAFQAPPPAPAAGMAAAQADEPPPDPEPTAASSPPLPDLSALPVAMREARRWLVWKSVANGSGKPRKKPYYANGQPRNGTLDTAPDLSALASLDTAMAALKTGNYTGLGFALGPDDTGMVWQGIDFDHLSEHPDLAALAESLPGYRETSPSGDGVHAIGHGRPFDSLGSNATGIEAYAKGRYFTVTGAALGGDIEDVSEFVTGTLAPLHSPGKRAQERQERPQAAPALDADEQTIRDLRSALTAIPADDYAIWINVGLALSELGGRGRSLWLEWSQTSDKYRPEDARKWEGFKASETGYRAVFREAERNGWVNPAKRTERPQERTERPERPRTAEGTPDTRADNATAPSFAGALLFDSKGETRRLIESKAADLVSDHLREQIAWDGEAGAWYVWEHTHWEPLTQSARADAIIAAAVHTGCADLGFRMSYLSGITTIMQRRGLLAPPAWAESVPFTNGLLDLETLSLAPATPNRATDWCLPWRYDPQADCPTVKAWLKRAVVDDETVELLRAWLGALVRGIPLQHVLTLIGRGGSGKGTFQRLATALVGIRNTAVTDLARLESNQFETARLFGKRLTMVNEAGRYGGSVDVLKALTGGDHVRLERKHVQQSGSFVYRGLVLMATNEHITTTDATSGLERRRMTVRFPTSATPAEKADWRARGGEDAVLHPEIPGIINWVLALSRDEIVRRFEHPPEQVAAENLLGMAAGNSVAEWMLEHCVPEPEVPSRPGNEDRRPPGCQIGVCKLIRHGSETEYEHADTRAYPNYLRYCEETGRKATSIRKFSDTVIDIAETLAVSVRKDRHPETRAATLYGIRLRGPREPHHAWSGARRDSPGGVEESPPPKGGVNAAARRDRRDQSEIFVSKKREAPETAATDFVEVEV